MTRKELEDMGLSKEQVDAIMKSNGTDIENAKAVEKATTEAEISSLKAENTGLKSQVKERDGQLTALTASTGDAEAMKQQIADLQKVNADAVAAHEKEMAQLKIDHAVEQALTAAKAKNIKATRALLELDDAKLDKDGSVKGLKEQIDKLAKDKATEYLFDTQKQPAFRGFQPGASADIPPGGADTSKMSYEEMVAYLDANPGAQI